MNTYHVVLKVNQGNQIVLPPQYGNNFFYFTYEFKTAVNIAFTISVNANFIPDYRAFMSDGLLDQVHQINLVSQDKWYSHAVIRNLSDEDRTHLTLLGLINEYTIDEITPNTHFYNVLEHCLPPEDEYFHVYEATKIPKTMHSKLMLISVSHERRPNDFQLRAIMTVSPLPEEILNISMTMLTNPLIMHNLTNEDKTYLALMGIVITKEDRPGYINALRDCVNFGRGILEYD